MLMIARILGASDDPDLHARLHAHEHADTREWVTLSRADLARRRMRVASDRGTEIAIALPRGTPLFDGAVLHLDAARAIVVRMEAEEWLRLRPRDAAAALRIGYHAGNLHWRARFEGDDLLVALERQRATYLDRLSAFLADGDVRLIGTHGDDGTEAPARAGGRA